NVKSDLIGEFRNLLREEGVFRPRTRSPSPPNMDRDVCHLCLGKGHWKFE
ncbi:hypothetical protein ScPMuIL_002131, partial [Solemya velum]